MASMEPLKVLVDVSVGGLFGKVTRWILDKAGVGPEIVPMTDHHILVDKGVIRSFNSVSDMMGSFSQSADFGGELGVMHGQKLLVVPGEDLGMLRKEVFEAVTHSGAEISVLAKIASEGDLEAWTILETVRPGRLLKTDTLPEATSNKIQSHITTGSRVNAEDELDEEDKDDSEEKPEPAGDESGVGGPPNAVKKDDEGNIPGTRTDATAVANATGMSAEREGMLMDFFWTNPNPCCEDIDDLANSIGMTKDQVNHIIYSMLGNILAENLNEDPNKERSLAIAEDAPVQGLEDEKSSAPVVREGEGLTERDINGLTVVVENPKGSVRQWK